MFNAALQRVQTALCRPFYDGEKYAYVVLALRTTIGQLEARFKQISDRVSYQDSVPMHALGARITGGRVWVRTWVGLDRSSDLVDFLGDRLFVSDRYLPCPVCPVLCAGKVGDLWPNGWTDQDET